MTLTFLRIGWIASLVSFLATLVHFWVHAVDPAQQDQYSRDVRHAQALDAHLDDYVVRARSGLLTQYDPLASTLRDLRRVNAYLGEPPGFLATGAREDVRVRARRSADVFKKKAELIDDFERENSVLRNSLLFFPTAASEAADRLPSTPEGRDLARRLHDLVRDVLLYNLIDDPDVSSRISTEADQLQADVPGDALGIVLAHARVVADRKPRVERLTDAILSLPTLPQVADLEAAYSTYYRGASSADNRRKLLLFTLLVAALAFGAAEIILRLQRSAAALAEASRTLENALVTLRREQEREKELSDLKTRFVSMTSHEFRTPLSIILSSSELLESYGERWPAEKKRDHFVRIQTAVKGMAQMLDKVLLIGKGDAGMMEHRPAPMDLGRCIDDVLQAVPQGESRVDVRLSGVDRAIVADEKLLRHVLVNLVSNAIKYSPSGERVRVSAVVDGGKLVLEVVDRGIGIAEADLAAICEPFHRGQNTGSIPGTGLGLSVVKKCVETHGGTLTIDSKVNVGTRIVAELSLGGRT